MLALSVHTPFDRSPLPSAEGPDLDGAIRRALAEAGTVSGAFASAPYRFRTLSPDSCARLRGRRPPGATGEACVLVTVRESGEAVQRAHLRERGLTAAQRFMLALSCEGVANTWTDDVPDAGALEALGVDLDGQAPFGLVWCAAER